MLVVYDFTLGETFLLAKELTFLGLFNKFNAFKFSQIIMF